MLEFKKSHSELIFDFESLPEWREDKRYDGYFYFNQEKYLIEMQGGQHYTKRWGSLEGQQKNDLIKKTEAIEHEWNFIEIDCRISDFDYIKSNVANSIFGWIFNLDLLNWDKVRENSEKIQLNKCVTYTTILQNFLEKLTELFKLSQCTVINYLSRGREIGWVNYLEEDGKPKFKG